MVSGSVAAVVPAWAIPMPEQKTRVAAVADPMVRGVFIRDPLRMIWAIPEYARPIACSHLLDGYLSGLPRDRANLAAALVAMPAARHPLGSSLPRFDGASSSTCSAYPAVAKTPILVGETNG